MPKPGKQAHPSPYTVEDFATAFIRLAGIHPELRSQLASHAKPGMDDFYII